MVGVTQLGQLFKQQWQTSFCFLLVRKGYDATPGTDIEKRLNDSILLEWIQNINERVK